MFKIKPGIMLYLKYLYPYTALTLYFPLKWVKLIYNQTANIEAFELIILAVVLAVPLIKTKRFDLTVSGSEINFKEGLFVTRKRCIKNPNLAVISIDRGAFSRLLCSAKVKIYSPSGVTSRPIISTYISRRSADRLERTLSLKGTQAVKRFRFSEILIYSLGNSSFVAGVFVAVPFINKVLTLWGNSLAEILKRSLGGELPQYGSFINIALKTPLIVLMLGYTFDFLKTFIDMFSFKLTENKDYISLRRGFIKLHTAFIPKECICAVVCRQTPVFSAFRKKSVSILSNGYGRPIKDSDCILPLTFENEHPSITSDLKVLINPAKKAKMRRLKPYLIFMAVDLLLAAIAEFVLPEFEIIHITLLGVFLYLLFAVIIRYENYNKCFFTIGSSTISVKAQHRLSIREMHLPKSRTAAIKITQNLFDQKYCVCKARVFAAHKRAVSVKIKNIPLNKTLTAVYESFVYNKP